MLAKLILAVVLGYLIGGIPFGVIAGKVSGEVDVRKYGSGKMGFTNVRRTVGEKSARVVLICDIAKGSGAVILARWLLGDAVVFSSWQTMPGCGYVASDIPLIMENIGLNIYGVQAMVAMAAVVGHNWSPYIKFQGGRGVATFFGGLVTMCWPISAICGLGILMGVTKLTRYVSLGSILSVTIASIIMVILFVLGHQPMESMVYALAAMSLILFQHRGNIQRLRAGTERKVGEEGERRYDV